MVCGKKEVQSVGACVTSSQTVKPSAPRPPTTSKCQRSQEGGEMCGRGVGRPTSLASYATAHSSDPRPSLPPFLQAISTILRIFTVPSKWSGGNFWQEQKRPVFASTQQIGWNIFQIGKCQLRWAGSFGTWIWAGGQIWGIMINREQQDESCKSQCDFSSGTALLPVLKQTLGVFLWAVLPHPAPPLRTQLEFEVAHKIFWVEEKKNLLFWKTQPIWSISSSNFYNVAVWA